LRTSDDKFMAYPPVGVPDAMRIAAAVGARTKAFGGHWCLPGGTPLSGRQAAEIAERYLGRPVKLRSAGMTTLRIVSLFNKDLRGCPQLHEAGLLRRAQTARHARAAADERHVDNPIASFRWISGNIKLYEATKRKR